jgi:high mobility group protein B1
MSSSSKPTLQSLNERLTAAEAHNSAQQTLIEALTERIVALEAAAPASAETTPAKKGRKPKKERAEKDPDAPKRPLGAYMRFCQAKRAESPTEKLKATDLGVMWAALSQDQKDAYKSSTTDTE